MANATKTLKLPFLRLNRAKAEEFARLQTMNTEVANSILAMPRDRRAALTSKHFNTIEIGSAWINQTIRNARARTKVKKFDCLPLETNNQNWTLHKVGDTYSVSFGMLRGVRKRIPLAIHQAVHAEWLDAVIAGTAKQGSIKLWCSRKRIWYACISVSKDVPDAKEPDKWIGVDRGQKIPAVAGLPDNGRVFFFKSGRIAHLRREFSKRRKKLQKAGKMRAIKKMERKERRIVTHINHCISKQIVGLAKRYDCGLRFEDLSGIRQTSRQRKTTKSDSGKNRDYWPFFQLEQFSKYKAMLQSVAVENIPAPYTSKTHNLCGHIGVRRGFKFYCPHCDKHEHADANASRNIGKWTGMFCAFDPSKASGVIPEADLAHGVDDSPLNLVSNANPLRLV